MATIKKIKKRNGQIVDFDQSKVTEAIWKAALSVGGTNYELAKKISKEVCSVTAIFFKNENDLPSVEQIQDLVEKILIENGHAKTAKAYILYREERKKMRAEKSAILGEIGANSNHKIPLSGLKILRNHFLHRNQQNEITETPEQLFTRVAKTAAQNDPNLEKNFYELLENLDFLPSSSVLMNAGNTQPQLASTISIKIEDDLENIFEAIKTATILRQNGAAVTFNFSHLRPKGARILNSNGLAAGPVAFMKLFDNTAEIMKEGIKRKTPYMAILNIDHPDILEFITTKNSPYPQQDIYKNLRIGVGITRNFMEALITDNEYPLINPQNHQVVNQLNAKNVFDLLVSENWKNNEPKIIFMDQLQAKNPLPKGERLSTVSPLGDQPLCENEATFMGFINLANHIKENSPDWDKLSATTAKAINFLDNLIDQNHYPNEHIKTTTTNNRKISIGIIGLPEALKKMNQELDTASGNETTHSIMHFIFNESKKASAALGEKLGSFPTFNESIYPKQGFTAMRNATTMAFASSKTIAQIAAVSALLSTDDLYDPEQNLEFFSLINQSTDALSANHLGFSSSDTIHHMKKIILKAYEIGFPTVSITRATSLSLQIFTTKPKYLKEEPTIDKQAILPFNDTHSDPILEQNPTRLKQEEPNSKKHIHEVALPPIQTIK